MFTYFKLYLKCMTITVLLKGCEFGGEFILLNVISCLQHDQPSLSQKEIIMEEGASPEKFYFLSNHQVSLWKCGQAFPPRVCEIQ